MIRVFVSFYPGDSAHAPALVQALRDAGCEVAHSPDPDAMGDWYASGLPAALDRSDVFVCVISPAWDSSTWMAIEADEARRRLAAGRIAGCFCYNPEGRRVIAAGMIPYLRHPLPVDLSEAVEVILACASRSSIGGPSIADRS